MKFTNRAEAHQSYRALLDGAKAEGGEVAQMATMAELGRRDLFFLLVYLLDRKDVDKDWLFARCLEVQNEPDGFLDLWARDHYKSTIITFAKTIQDVLIDSEITAAIFSHTRPIAKAFLGQIKEELEQNGLLKELYFDVLYGEPKRQSPRWTDEAIRVKRDTNPKEDTIEAWGLVDGQPTSRHYRLMIYDDTVTEESVNTPDMIEKTNKRLKLSFNLGSQGQERRRFVGTRFHFNDTYAEIIKNKIATPRIYPATVNGEMDGDPVMLPREVLAQKRRDMGPYVYGCQMLLNPVADRVQGFREEWLDYWEVEEAAWRKMNLYLLVDPASEKKKTSDYSVFTVWGLGSDGNYYLVDMVRDRLNLTERTETLFKLHRTYKPLNTGYEKYGMQSDIEHIKGEMKREHYRFEIIELGGSMPKNDRIRRLIPLFENGRIYLPHRLIYVNREKLSRDLTQELVDDEFLAFPVSAHDDMLDCMARITEADMKTKFPEESKVKPEPEYTSSYRQRPRPGMGSRREFSMGAR